MLQKITPFLWYNSQAEEAAKFYTSIFANSKIIETGSVAVTFELEGIEFIAFNGGPTYQFGPAISLFIRCETQEEVDYYWKRLSQGGKEIRCGWLCDPFGLSWQIVPTVLSELLGDPDPVKADRARQAMLGMKKLDIGELKKAHAG